jgi:excisionase family DNA binding protein
MTTKNDPTLTLAEAASRLGVAHSTLTKQAKNKRLRAV